MVEIICLQMVSEILSRLRGSYLILRPTICLQKAGLWIWKKILVKENFRKLKSGSDYNRQVFFHKRAELYDVIWLSLSGLWLLHTKCAHNILNTLSKIISKLVSDKTVYSKPYDFAFLWQQWPNFKLTMFHQLCYIMSVTLDEINQIV